LSPFSLQGQEVLHIGGQYGLMECIHCVCEAAIFIFPPKFCVSEVITESLQVLNS
jgi:hypothetical protein